MASGGDNYDKYSQLLKCIKYVNPTKKAGEVQELAAAEWKLLKDDDSAFSRRILQLKTEQTFRFDENGNCSLFCDTGSDTGGTLEYGSKVFDKNGNCSLFCDIGSDTGGTPGHGSKVYITNISKVDCGVLEVKNGSLVSTSTFVGNRGTIKCDELFQFFGNNDSAVCQSSRMWAGPDGQCLQVEWRNQTLPDGVGHYLAVLPEPIRDGWETVFNGIPETNNQFHVDIRDSSDLYVVFSSRLRNQNLVFNSRFSLIWEKGSGEFIRPDIFPFQVGVLFELRIAYHNGTFMFFANGGFIYNYTATHPVVMASGVYIALDIFIERLKFIY
ncbi:uncharacterized protein LOC121369773 [Gigantopelta aegis]|uniref:uncharacterized protein LOC121369773 n=1 Tax=Gigantopelta aegis TaxID=1735272 RepID=UPI001B88DD52|nr:uncharacterized protein LOC121369773 [Gigantopelta aegis]